MTDLWVRQVRSDLEQPCYRWYMRESAEHGCCTLSEMAARWPEASLTLLIPGTDCPSRRLAFNPAEKRHLARLIPFELEAELAQDIAGVHVALGAALHGKKNVSPPDVDETGAPAAREQEVVLCYMDRHALAERISALESAGFDVRRCYAEPLLLPGSAGSWVLRLVDEQVDISWGPGNTASVDLVMLGVTLETLLHSLEAEGASAPRLLQLQALTMAELDVLKAHLSASVLAQTWQPELSITQLKNVWQGLDGVGVGANSEASKVAAATPDLRQGAFARPVRWHKYWPPLRLPVIAASLAALSFVAVTLIETQLNDQRFRALQQDIEMVYRDVVPGGVLVDAEQQLRAQLSQLRGDSTGGSVLTMLDRITPHLSQNPQVSINRLSFNGGDATSAAGELQLSIQAESNTDILQLSEQLGHSGFQARAQNLTQSGNRQQASMIITETVP